MGKLANLLRYVFSEGALMNESKDSRKISIIIISKYKCKQKKTRR